MEYFLTQKGGSQHSGSDRRWEPWLGKAPLGKSTSTFFLFQACQGPAHMQKRPEEEAGMQQQVLGTWILLPSPALVCHLRPLARS